MERSRFLIYGDESSDEKQKQVWTFAGAIGTEDEWAALEHVWRCRTQQQEFHANSESEFCSHGRTPDPVKHQARLGLYRDLTTILVESYVAGMCISMDIRSYNEVFGVPITDIGYYHCVSTLIDQVARTTERFNASGESTDVKFIFDERVTSQESVRDIYRAFGAQPEWRETTLLKGVSFTTSADPRVQVADLLAREARKDMQRFLGYEKRIKRRSFEGLENCGKFIFIRRGRPFWEQLREAMPRLAEETGFTQEAYLTWLREHALADTAQSRARFLRHLDETRNR